MAVAVVRPDAPRAYRVLPYGSRRAMGLFTREELLVHKGDFLKAQEAAYPDLPTGCHKTETKVYTHWCDVCVQGQIVWHTPGYHSRSGH